MTLSTTKAILNYQFGDKVGDKIIEKYKENIKLEISKSTGRIRRIYINNKLFGTVEPSTGFIIPTFFGGEIIKTFLPFPKYRVIVSEEAIPFVLDGKSVFCKFVIDLDNNILPEDVVFVVDRKDNLLAIGISKLSSEEIKRFKRGVAIKIKHVRKNL
ncbi:MAG: PUA domain-containing protein [Candidatus Aenigmatarchaeota archaeon]